jgi:hypothetical protein
MKDIKLFENWLKENEKVRSSLASFFKNTWTEQKFPWEAEILEKLEEFKTVIDSLDSNFETNRYGESSDPTYHLDIKFYGGPDTDRLSKKYDLSDDAILDSWHEYLSQQLESFTDSLDYGWLQDTWQSGRSGGWLTLEAYPQYCTENAVDRVVEHLDNYVYEVDDYEPITPEELYKMRGSIFSGSYGLGTTDKAKSIKFLKDEKDLLIKNIDVEIDMMKTLLEDLENTQKLIEEGMKGLEKGFEKYIQNEELD